MGCPHHRTYRLILFLLSVALLTACAPVGPDYQPPQTAMPSQWSEGTGSGNTPATTLSHWWSLFRDPLLDSLIARALTANPDLRIAETRVVEARAARRIATASLLPSVDLGGSYTTSRRSERVQSSDRYQDVFETGFDAGWELDLFGGVRRQAEAAEANLAATVEDWRDVCVSLAAEVARNYIELRSSQQRLAIARENSRIQEQTVEVVRNKFHLGLGSDLEVAQAETLLAQTRAEMPLLESSAAQAMHQLALLLGQQPQTLKLELTAEAPLPPVPPHLPHVLPSELLRQRPDIRSAERRLAAATATVGAATADLFPRFSLSALIGLQSTSLGDLIASGSRFWSAGPAVRWPLFDGGTARAAVDASEAQRRRAELTYEQTVLTALTETENALVTLERERTTHAILQEAVKASQRAVVIAHGQYQAGITPFLNVLQSQNALYQSQDKLAQSGQRLAIGMLTLYKALGGGWQTQPLPAATLSRTTTTLPARNIP